MASLSEVLGFSSILGNRKDRLNEEGKQRRTSRNAAASVLDSGPGGISLAAPDNTSTGDLSQKVLGNLLGTDNLQNDVLTNPLFIPGSDFKSEIGEDGSATFDFTQIGGQSQTFDSIEAFNELSGNELLELVGPNAFDTKNASGQSTVFAPSLTNDSRSKLTDSLAKGSTEQKSANDANGGKDEATQSDFLGLFDKATPEKQQQILELLNGT